MFTSWPFLFGSAILFLAFSIWWSIRDKKTKLLISAYGDIQENGILIDLIYDFRKSNPDVEVLLERFPFSEYTREVKAAIRAGAGPDVTLMDSAHYSEFVFDGLLDPLNPYFVDDHLDINVFYNQVVDRFFLDGFLYAMPRDVAPICMVYYNKSAFEEAGLAYPQDGWNWDQFVETAVKTMRVDHSGNVVRWGFVEGWAMFEAWVYDAGGSFVDDIKHPTRWTIATDPHSLRGLQFRWDLIHKYKVMPPPSVWNGYNDTDSVEMFAEGQASMILFGLWKTPRFREIKGFRWDAAMIPRDPHGRLDFTLTGSAYAIPKSAKNKKEAWKFVKYVSGEEGSKKLAADGLSQPAIEKIANSDYFLDKKDPLNKKLLLSAMKHGKYAPLCRNWSEVKSIIERELNPAWEGKITVREALDRLKPLLDKVPPQGH